MTEKVGPRVEARTQRNWAAGEYSFEALPHGLRKGIDHMLPDTQRPLKENLLLLQHETSTLFYGNDINGTQ